MTKLATDHDREIRQRETLAPTLRYHPQGEADADRRAVAAGQGRIHPQRRDSMTSRLMRQSQSVRVTKLVKSNRDEPAGDSGDS